MNHNDIIIRTVQADDEDGVAALWKLVFPNAPPWNKRRPDFQRKAKENDDCFLVALNGTQIIGTAMGGFDGHRGWIYYVAVHPEFRRKNVGSRMMNNLENRLRNRGCTKINLQVRAHNTGVVKFYEKLGYSVEPHTSMGKLLVVPDDIDAVHDS